MDLFSNVTQALREDVSRWMGYAKDARNKLRAVDALQPYLPDLEGLAGVSASVINFSKIEITIWCPWDTVLVDTVCLRFQQLGWELLGELDRTKEYQYRDYIYLHNQLENVKVVIRMSASNSRSKCKVIEHEETYTKKVYQVQCEDMLNI